MNNLYVQGIYHKNLFGTYLELTAEVKLIMI